MNLEDTQAVKLLIKTAREEGFSISSECAKNCKFTGKPMSSFVIRGVRINGELHEELGAEFVRYYAQAYALHITLQRQDIDGGLPKWCDLLSLIFESGEMQVLKNLLLKYIVWGNKIID